MAYEISAGGIFIIILIEILKDYYFFHLAVPSHKEPFRVAAPTSSG